MSAQKVNRRKSRETAFTLLFEWSFHEQPLELTFKSAWECRELEVDAFARELCVKTVENRERLDSLIEAYSSTWKLGRLSRVTLSVLRMAFCEITMFDDIPLGATINEAVELCKTYSTEDEAAYVNGILGQYGRDSESGKPVTTGTEAGHADAGSDEDVDSRA